MPCDWCLGERKTCCIECYKSLCNYCWVLSYRSTGGGETCFGCYELKLLKEIQERKDKIEICKSIRAKAEKRKSKNSSIKE